MKRSIFAILIISLLLSSLISIPLGSYNVNATEIQGYESNITDDYNSQGKPAIFGDYVVWNENMFENGTSNWEICLYDLSVDTNGDDVPNYLENSSTGGRPEPDPARIRITNNVSLQLGPKIYGNIIVWEDNRHGNFDIYMYDLSEDTDGDNIPNYLDDDDDGDSTLDVNDEDPDLAEIRVTDHPAHQEKPSVYGNKIVWVDSRYGNKDIFLYDLVSNKESLIAGFSEIPSPHPTDPSKFIWPQQDYPKIYGNLVVYEDNRDGNNEIYGYNLSLDSDFDGIPNYLDLDREISDSGIRITNNSVADYRPSIYKNNIAYTRSHNIYVYNLNNNLEYKLTQSNDTQKIYNRPCSIYGSKVVWTYDDGTKDIYIYDLALDSDTDGIPNYMDSEVLSPDPAMIRLTNESEPQIMLPEIYSDKIVWQDSRNTTKPADRDIFIFTITENKAPEIDYVIPNYNPKIEEGESFIFQIVADDPEGVPLEYRWYYDEKYIPNNDTLTLEFISDHAMAGMHEIKVIISDGEFPIEYIWNLEITESGLDPIEIIWVEPSVNPIINEGEEISFEFKAKYLGNEEPIILWNSQSWDAPPTELYFLEGGTIVQDNEILSGAKIFSQLESNGTNYQRTANVTVKITVGTNNITYNWKIVVVFLEDADFDGYNDSLEIEWNSDPLDPLSTPPDLDHDLILDLEDNDIDGDGLLDAYDENPTNFNKQMDANPDNSVELLLLLISVILLIFSFYALSRVQKYTKRKNL
jgi:beta propeller repeat protein